MIGAIAAWLVRVRLAHITDKGCPSHLFCASKINGCFSNIKGFWWVSIAGRDIPSIRRLGKKKSPIHSRSTRRRRFRDSHSRPSPRRNLRSQRPVRRSCDFPRSCPTGCQWPHLGFRDRPPCRLYNWRQNSRADFFPSDFKKPSEITKSRPLGKPTIKTRLGGINGVN